MMRGWRPALLSALVVAGSCADVSGQETFAEANPRVRIVPSEFRENVNVEFLYKQDLWDVYFTTWLGREEKRDGKWRDIYYETSEKYVAKGILSFQCFADDMNGDPTIDVIEYGTNDFGDPSARRVTKIDYEQRQAWMNGELDALLGESPPYELFVVAHYRFCGDEWKTTNSE
jgi:hypothetical protein